MNTTRSGLSFIGSAFLYIFFVFPTVVIVLIGIFIPLYQQVMTWLRFGHVPPRDLYWLFADSKCEKTGWKPRGWEGLDVCRKDYIEFTDWIGLNKLANYMMDIHISIYGIVVLFFLFIIWAFVDDHFERKKLMRDL